MFRDLQPPNEWVHRAILWISEQRIQRPSADTVALIDEASKRFDLTPVEEEFLYQALREPV